MACNVVCGQANNEGIIVKDTFDNNSYFKMGAAVAVSELFGSGRLGEEGEVVHETREFLHSFGIRGMDDVEQLGIRGPYIEDLARIYGCEV